MLKDIYANLEWEVMGLILEIMYKLLRREISRNEAQI